MTQIEQQRDGRPTSSDDAEVVDRRLRGFGAAEDVERASAAMHERGDRERHARCRSSSASPEAVGDDTADQRAADGGDGRTPRRSRPM